jgi:uncharacterized membrane protein
LLPNPPFQGRVTGDDPVPAPWPAPALLEPIAPVAAQPVGQATTASPVRVAREVGVDAVRGLAVFVMVGANMVRNVLDQPYPFWLRLYSSLAGPAFILLAGYLVGRVDARRSAPLRGYLKRTLALLLVAALVDVLIWGQEPFASFDVLYVIALVPPVSHLILRCSRTVAMAATAVMFLATPALQATLGYETATFDPAWTRLRALLVDGWFPLFPWLGVGVLGATLGAFRERAGAQLFASRGALLGPVLLAVGLATWWLSAVQPRAPAGFAELFYPPTLGVLLAILGPEIWLLARLSEPTKAWLWRGFAVYGRVALAMYVAHLAIIRIVFGPWLDHQSIPTFLALYLAHAIVLWWLAFAMRRLVPSPRSFWGRLLLGG